MRRNIRIRFIGVWDTVAAYGMPVDEMTRGIHRYLWPLELPNNRLAASVDRACQALALDEERTTFHPHFGTRAAASRPIRRRGPQSSRRALSRTNSISQVWFAGVHSNVGGGYPDDSLAYIPFVWMITEARRCGLQFKSDYADDPDDPDVMRADPDTFKNAISKRDKDGKHLRSAPRARRLLPLRAAQAGARLCNPEYWKNTKTMKSMIERAKIHESVFKRLDNHAHAYAPIGLPPIYDVVRDDGEIVTPDRLRLLRQARAPWSVRKRRSTSGTTSGNADLSISQPSAPRSGWWCFR